jgi:hypothetical protein
MLFTVDSRCAMISVKSSIAAMAGRDAQWKVAASNSAEPNAGCGNASGCSITATAGFDRELPGHGDRAGRFEPQPSPRLHE